jgi:hypothetical protein
MKLIDKTQDPIWRSIISIHTEREEKNRDRNKEHEKRVINFSFKTTLHTVLVPFLPYCHCTHAHTGQGTLQLHDYS